MRIFFLLALFAMTFNAPFAFADENEIQPLPSLEQLMSQEDESSESNEIPASEEEANSPEEPQETSRYAGATDQQIEEAQKFYKYCTTNDTMSARKDCKCSAARFLEARIKYGSTTSRQKIVLENLNTCLLDGVEQTPEIDVSNITQKQLDEANGVYKLCKSNYRLNDRHDCECYASKFLELRLDEGPMLAQDIIKSRLHNQCRDMVKLAGQEYSICMMKPLPFGVENIAQKDFCECYVQSWSKDLEARMGTLNMTAQRNLKVISRQRCMNPDAYIDTDL